MIKDNKVSKYLMYAIGEIALVMIGILLALQVNNLNEERKYSIKEQQILDQLKAEYEANLLQLEQKISHRGIIIQSATKVLKYIDEPLNINKDSLISRVSVMFGTPTFKPIQNDLIISGNLRLIKNENLKQLLTTWPSNVVALQEVEQIWDKIMQESVVPLFINFGILRAGLYDWWNDEQNLKWILEGKGDNPFGVQKPNNTLEISEIFKNKQLEGITAVAISVNHSANIQSQVLRKRILEILELLNKEIEIE